MSILNTHTQHKHTRAQQEREEGKKEETNERKGWGKKKKRKAQALALILCFNKLWSLTSQSENVFKVSRIDCKEQPMASQRKAQLWSWAGLTPARGSAGQGRVPGVGFLLTRWFAHRPSPFLWERRQVSLT